MMKSQVRIRGSGGKKGSPPEGNRVNTITVNVYMYETVRNKAMGKGQQRYMKSCPVKIYN